MKRTIYNILNDCMVGTSFVASTIIFNSNKYLGFVGFIFSYFLLKLYPYISKKINNHE